MERIIKTALLWFCIALLMPASAMATTAVIYDTDMAIDDWLALLLLASHPEIELKAISIAAAGESHCEPGVRNALALIHACAKASTPP